MKSYIGITDFTSRTQVQGLLEACGPQLEALGRQLMVGVMMSHKTLNGLPSQWSGVFPRTAQIASIFMDHPLVLNTIHFADYTAADLPGDIPQLLYAGGQHLHAIQFDMTWPKAPPIIELKQAVPHLKLILQIGRMAFEQVREEPIWLVRLLRRYQGSLDAVLLDRSMGSGAPMAAHKLRPFIWAIREAFPDMKIAVAGGLGPGTLYLLDSLAIEFPDLSIDAQGRLRPNGNPLVEPVDWVMATNYLLEAAALFERVRR